MDPAADAAVRSGAPVLYDDARARRFEPFATSRPFAEMRVGALLVRERWEHVLGSRAAGFVSAAHLRAFCELDVPPFAASLPAGTVLVNSRAVPYPRDTAPRREADGWDVLRIGGRVAAVRLSDAMPADLQSALERGEVILEDLATSTMTASDVDGVWIDEVWDILAQLSPLLLVDIPALAARVGAVAHADGNTDARTAGAVVGGGSGHQVWLEPGATVEPFTVFDVSLGPILVRRGSTVQAFTRVVGPCYIGIDSTVMADRISGSAIGDVCRVHGELSASVFLGHANKGHDGFVGHSIVGRWVNMGAGTITSNLKNTYGTVALWTPSGVRDTGQQFLGTLFGDHAKTGIGMRLTTGCVLGAGANVMDRMPPKVVAPFAWGTGEPYATFALDKFLETAGRMMSRRHVMLDARQREFWKTVHGRATAHPLSSQA